MNIPLLALSIAGLTTTAHAEISMVIPITNGGFEDPVLAPGLFQDAIPGWTEGKYDVLAPAVWVVGGIPPEDVGVWFTDIIAYPSGNAPEGQNTGYAVTSPGFDMGMNQVLSAALQANSRYNLSVKVGNPYIINVDDPVDYRIDFLAGGVLLQSATGTSPADGTRITTANLTYTSGATPTQLGQPLEIRLLAVNSTGSWVDFDDVVLTRTLISPDITPPTLTSIVDDRSGGPVAVSSLVTYTITFSEDLDASTVSTTDFDNAGTSAITIGTITESTPGVFTVPITPTSAGTLQLKINAGAIIQDAAGNALDTATDIPDATILSVSASGYATWASANAPGSNPDDDTDGDGVSNAVEFVLGGTSATNDLGKLPQHTTSGGNILFTFQRDQASIDGTTTVVIEVGTDGVTWPNSFAVPDGAGANNPGVTVVKDSPTVSRDTVTLTLPLAPDPIKFARLKVTTPEGSGYTLPVGYGGDYAMWQSVNGTNGGYDEDHDNDGVLNGIEYFLGGPNGNTTGFTALPGVTNPNGTYSVTWLMGPGYTGVYGTDFVVETSTTLAVGSWITAAEITPPTPDAVYIGGNEITYIYPVGINNFARLKVVSPGGSVATTAPLRFGWVNMDYITVGDPGNQVDPVAGFGAVPYEYKIARYAVTNSQYAEFLNAKAAADPYSLYNPGMSSHGITRSGSEGSYTYVVTPGFESQSVVYVSWFDAARFVNWLANGQGDASTETGTYTLNGAMSGFITYNAGASPFIPSEDEWWKAARYDGNTASYSLDTSYYGLVSSENIVEWTDSETFAPDRLLLSNGFFGFSEPTAEQNQIGFRVASVSEAPPSIVTHPASQTIASGSTANLTVTATGTEPLTYQWYQGISGNTSTPVGTNSASFTTPLLTSNTSYWVKVSNAADPAGVNSDTATVTVSGILVPNPLPPYDGSTGVANKPVKVYIMSGDEGMISKGKVSGTAPGTLNTIVNQQGMFPYLLNGSGGWVTRNDVVVSMVDTGGSVMNQQPLSPTWLGDAIGPELGFGHVMGWYHDEPVLLIRAANGNRALGWDLLPPDSPRFDWTNGQTYPGYGESPQSWVTGSFPSPSNWYAGKEYDAFFLDEPDMGPALAWQNGYAYPFSAYTSHNGVLYQSTVAHTASLASEPGVGADWAASWLVVSINNTVDFLDNFATQYPQWAAQGFEIAGFVMWQGLRDSWSSVYSEKYQENLPRFINQLRQYYANRYPGQARPDAPFVLGTIATVDPIHTARLAQVANAQLAVDGFAGNHPEYAGNVKTIEARSFWRSPAQSPATDGNHYHQNAETYMLAGDALGRGMVELFNSKRPLVTTGTASAVSETTVTLSGTVNPNGLSSTAQFVYGTTTAYGSSAAVTLLPPDGTDNQSLSVNLTGLWPNTTYHYRLSSTNADGYAQGLNRTFATSVSEFTWVSDVDGLWSHPTNWENGNIPDGASTDLYFDAIDIQSDRQIGLDSSRTVGRMIFGDSNPATAAGWTLSDTGIPSNILTLAGITPEITVNTLGAGKEVTIASQIAGTSGLTKGGGGTLVLGGNNSYSGVTQISAGVLKLGASEKIPGDLINDGALDLNTFSETIDGLSGTGVVDTLAGGTPTLTVGGNNASSVFSGVIRNTTGSLSLIKTGDGILTLSGANTFSGTVTVSNGTLAVANMTSLNNCSGITLAGGTTFRPDVVSVVFSAPIILGTNGTTATINAPSIAGSGGTNPVPLTLSGAINGAGNVTFSGIQNTNAYGTIYLNAASNYTGSTLITCTGSTNSNIFVRIGIDNALPPTTVLTLDGGNGTGGGRFCVLNLNGHDQTLAGLTNVTGRTLRSQRVNNTSATAATLTINNTSDFTFSGQLGVGGTNFGLSKSEGGVLTLSGNNTYVGSTTITGGTLVIGSQTSLPANTSLVMSGGKLDLNGQNATVRSLAVGDTDVIIDFGSTGNANTLQITDGALPFWTGTLVIRQFNPATDSLFFGSNIGGINGNAAQVIFIDPIGYPSGIYTLISGADGAALLSSSPISASVITTQPTSQAISSGNTAVLAVTAYGNPPPDLQWYVGSSGDTSNPILGATSASFTTPALSATTSYWVQATNTTGPPANSNTATITVGGGLILNTYDHSFGSSFLDPIANLKAVIPSGTGVQFAKLEVTLGNVAGSFPGLTSNDNFSILWEGWFDVSKDGPGDYTFGTESDDGSVVYLDLNDDGDFADAGELVVDNNFDQGKTARTGTVKLNMDAVRIAIGYYDRSFDESMSAKFKKGRRVTFESLDSIDPSSGHFYTTQPPTRQPAANLWNFGLPGYSATIEEADIAWTVPHGTDLTSLGPIFTISSGANSVPPSGTVRNFDMPQTYTVTSQNGVSKTYTVTVLTGPPGSEDLVHRWSFDSHLDSIGGAHLILRGNAEVGEGQLQLPGSITPRTHYASVSIGGTIGGLTSMTVETWFTLDAINTWNKLWMFGNPNGGNQPGLSLVAFNLQTDGGFPRIDFDTEIGNGLSTSAVPNPSALATATQYHVATVYDAPNDQMRFYINGVLSDSASMGGWNISHIGNTVQNFLGATVNYNDPDLDGRIEEVRIWNRALTDDEINQNLSVGPDHLPMPDIVVEEPADMEMAAGVTRNFGNLVLGTGGVTKTFVVRNNGTADLSVPEVSVSGDHAADFAVGSIPPFALQPGAFSDFTVTFAPGGTGQRNATLSIASNDAEDNPFIINLTGTGTATPIITTQPSSQTIIIGASATVSVATSGAPAPTFQWYQGPSGDTSNPISGAISDSFVTPTLSLTTSYWVRATNLAGTADSATAVITVRPRSADASLEALVLSVGTLSPAFDPAVTSYGVGVGNPVTSLFLSATAADDNAVVRINDVLVNEPVIFPILLNVGVTSIQIEVTAEDGVTMRDYSVSITRAAAVGIETNPAELALTGPVSLKGTVTPNGVASVFFQYGETTAYGSATPTQVFQGTQALDFSASVDGLKPATIFNFRAVAMGASGPVYGNNRTFTTSPGAPDAATGDPTSVSGSSATLVGAVDPKGLPTAVYFEYGLTTLYGRTTEVRTITSAEGIVDILTPNGGLIANATYHYRIVASSAAGTRYGDDVTFTVVVGSGVTNPIPTIKPEARTDGTFAVTANSAILSGNVDPNQGTTVVKFEFGTTTAYGRSTVAQGVGNGDEPVDVSLKAEGLLPGTTYQYRVVASNSAGTTPGANAQFTTAAAPPTAVTGGADVLSTTRVRVNGSVRAAGGSVNVFIDYGTDPFVFSASKQATPASVNGSDFVAVSAELENLGQGLTIYYRVRAVASGGVPAVGKTESFQVALISGLIQQFPDNVAPAARQGALNVTISPPLPASGWRFLGEKPWRLSGIPATGLTPGDRLIEFRPVAGSIQPPNESVSIASDGVPTELTRSYTPSGETGSGSLTVTLRPQGLTAETQPFNLLAKWAVFGEVDGDGQPVWCASDETKTGLLPGNHVIIAKKVDGRSKPQPITIRIRDAETTTATITYYVEEEETGTPPSVVDFETVSAATNLPHAYVGQLRGDPGSGSGFVVRPGVVATAGHVMFDDGTLSSATGMQWLHRHDEDVHDPVPLIPRGYYLLSGYAAQRTADASPGTSTPESQTLDAAAVYFLSDPGSGGFSGYLASDSASNEFLLSSALKTLVGYPIDRIAEENWNRLHATPPANVTFTPAYGRTYTTSEIRSSGGGSGGPLCVRYENGNYYPAAIYLGGTRQTVVRALDSEVGALIGFAEASAAASAGNTGGSITDSEDSIIEDPVAGALEVRIEPAAARAAGAGWRIQASSPWRVSGTRVNDLAPNIYTVRFASVPGFVPPAAQVVAISASSLKTITFTYQEIVLPPVIGPPFVLEGSRGQPLDYQIAASNAPDTFSLQGTLPGGLTFDGNAGRISGTPNEAGVFEVTIGAANSGGADSRSLTITCLPVLVDQNFTVPYNQPLLYQIASSESGEGVVFGADDLPEGLALDPATGAITGTPVQSGSFTVPIRVTRRGATEYATLDCNFTGTEPVFVSQPEASRTIDHGGTTTLSVVASGLPVPNFQWYVGTSGVTSQPITGAKSANFTTPQLTAETSFWVRVSSISGSVDSSTFTVSVLPSNNANLAGLGISAGLLSPPFNAGIFNYSVRVANAASTITLTPIAEVPESSIRINGVAVDSGSAGIPTPLSVGGNSIHVQVTADDGINVVEYTIDVLRAAPPSMTTGPVADADADRAILGGSVVPNGDAIVFFEYGKTNSYGIRTPFRDVSGFDPIAVQSLITGLDPATTYHYRIGVTSAGIPEFGNDSTFTTDPAPPLAATGTPTLIGNTEATLTGAINPLGRLTQVFFQYGEDTTYGQTTTPSTIEAGSDVVDVPSNVDNLIPDGTYHYRLVASSASGTSYGGDVVFQATATGPGGGVTAAPEADTGPVSDVTSNSAVLQADVDPNNLTTFIRFEYGLTPSYGSTTASKGIGNGNDSALVIMPIEGLLPGTEYHYRVIATNSADSTTGLNRSFMTLALPPNASTGEAEALSPTSARISGTVRARGVATDVFVEFWADGVVLPTRLMATPGVVSDNEPVAVGATLANLERSKTYNYRLVVERGGVPSYGDVKSFQPDVLFGRIQKFSNELPSSSREASLTVILRPSGLGGWRFVGERRWRASGSTVGGLTNGDRLIEFRPVDGHIQPPREQVGIVNGEVPQVIERSYFTTLARDARLRVVLAPNEISGPAVPLSSRAQWKLAGETAWHDSGVEISGRQPGSYLVEYKPVAGRNTPPASIAELINGQTTNLSIAYMPVVGATSSPMLVVPFSTSSTSRELPYAYVGQLRSDTGSHSGFVVKRRVVATTSTALFNDVTLARSTGLQWLLQRDQGSYEPTPQVPRGSYVFTGYADQRTSESTPGTLSLESQNLNVAVLYFAEDAGRGGFSGYLSSDDQANETLQSGAAKTVVGYPVNGVSETDLGRMHATPSSGAPFTWTSGRIYSNSVIRGIGGMDGGPLCVQVQQGAYFPAAIYLGGPSRNLVRAIDSDVIEMFNSAEIFATTGQNSTNGGITRSDIIQLSTTQSATIEVTIIPSAAVTAFAGWRLAGESSYSLSGDLRGGLGTGVYSIELKPAAGFQTPAPQDVPISAGQLKKITIEYAELLPPLESWRKTYFNVAANPAATIDSADPDGDGKTNIEEYAAGTNPMNPADSFKVLTATKSAGLYALTTNGKASRSYVLERKENLGSGSWTAVDSEGPLTADGPVSLTDSAPPADRGFYRIRVSAP